MLKIEDVTMVGANLSKDQVEEILTRIIVRGSQKNNLIYLNIKSNNVSAVENSLIENVYKHLKSFIVDKYI